MLFHRTCLVFLLILMIGFSSIGYSQNENSNSEEKVQLKEEMEFEQQDYRAYISNQYVQRFKDFTELLSNKESQLDKNLRNHENLKNQLSYANNPGTKQEIKDQIKGEKITEKKINEEIKLIRRAIKILQNNREKPDPDKLSALNQVNQIENEIVLTGQKFENERSEILLSSVTVEERDVYLNPHSKDCLFDFNGIDPSTKKERVEIKKQFLFGYTHPKLKTHFKDRHYLKCESQLIQLDNKLFLRLFITISSKDAIKNYGYIEKNSALKIELLDKEIIYVPSSQNAIGKLEPYTGNTLYEVILPLDKPRIKALERGEIDKVGIMWTSGYEEYEVYHVDQVMNQINCLKNN